MDERLSWRGREIAWTSFGRGPDVVFCHGTPWRSALWRPYADALAGDHTVYLWDMPGYGDSSKRPDHAVDLGVQGELFAELLGIWGLDAPHVVAHDIGGAVALRAHLLHGACYASLCLVDVVALRPWGSPFFRLVHEHAEVFTALPSAVHAGALAAYLDGASARGIRPADLAMLLEPWLDPAGQAAFYRQIAEADERFTDEIEPHYADLAIPVRVVWGAEDEWIPRDRADRLAAAIPGATLRIIEGAGHLVQLDQPTALADELRSWLTSRTSDR